MFPFLHWPSNVKALSTKCSGQKCIDATCIFMLLYILRTPHHYCSAGLPGIGKVDSMHAARYLQQFAMPSSRERPD